jgi:transcriptional regulator with XRE-family HTH domain
MNVADKINYLLEEKGITKREFAQKLLSLNPILDRTGKAPSESTIYGYLNGGREIKIELIPYIAETLNVTEQELFTNEIEFINDYSYKYSKDTREILDLLKFAPRGANDEIKKYLLKYKKTYDEGIR